MIINNIGINFAGGGGGGGDARLESKNYNLTENGSTSISPSSGYDGISGGTIQVNVDLQPSYNSGYTDGIAAQKALLSSTTINNNGTYTSEDGFSAVTVDVQSGGENRLNTFLKNSLTAITESDLSGVTSISDYKFYNLSNLKEVSLPASVTGLSRGSFAGTGIETIDVSDVKQYASEVFKDCKSLTGITGFENYTGFPYNGMFQGCSALTGDLRVGMATKNNDMTSIMSLFAGCKNLKSVTWLRNQNEVDYNSQWSSMYSACTSIEFLDYTHNTIVPPLRWVNPFASFTANYEIRVPDLLYDEWTATTNWNNSAIVGHIKSYPHQFSIFELRYTTTDSNSITPGIPYNNSAWTGTYKTEEYDAVTGGTVTFWGENITIPTNAYYGKTTLDTITLPVGVTKINSGAFSGCSNLISVDMPEGVTLIDNSAFTNCNLTSVVIPSTVTSVGRNAFRSNSGLTSITCYATTAPTIGATPFADISQTGVLYIPYGSDYSTWIAKLPSGWTVNRIHVVAKYVTSQPNQSVKVVRNESSYSIPQAKWINGYPEDQASSQGSYDGNGYYTFANAGVNTITYYLGDNADILPSFLQESEVNTVLVVSPNITSIVNYGFTSCANLVQFNGPSVTALGNKVFRYNSALKDVHFGNIISMGDNVFGACTSLTEFHFGNAISSVSYNPFNGASNLSTLTFDANTTGLTYYQSIGDNTTSLTEVVFPDCIQTYCQDSMQYGLFYGSSSLSAVTFGSGATTFQGLAFGGNMPALTSITCKAPIAPSIVSGCFSGVTSNVGTLYVPQGSDYSTWAAALGSNWTVSDTL